MNPADAFRKVQRQKGWGGDLPSSSPWLQAVHRSANICGVTQPRERRSLLEIGQSGQLPNAQQALTASADACDVQQAGIDTQLTVTADIHQYSPIRNYWNKARMQVQNPGLHDPVQLRQKRCAVTTMPRGYPAHLENARYSGSAARARPEGA